MASQSPPGAFFVLGAADPEMRATERLLADGNHAFTHARVDGKRVHPANAYRAPLPVAAGEALAAGATVYLVECVGDAVPGTRRIDHHHPGDPGYGRPPDEYWPASSLGQTIAVIDRLQPGGMTVTPQLRMIAAADHCLGAAYRGLCPGVDPAALLDWHIAARAAFEKRPPAALRRDIETGFAAIHRAPRLALGNGMEAVDLRGRHIAELPIVAAHEDCCCISAVKARDGRVKIGCLVGSPAQVEAFMQLWAPAHQLVDIYGDPARGFAGAYVPRT